MTTLSWSEPDATLASLMSSGSMRAASSLADLTGLGVRVELGSMISGDDSALASAIEERLSGDLVCVGVAFSGGIAGVSLLLVGMDSAQFLVAAVDEPNPVTLSTRARDVLSEVGSILLNSCVGVIANVLGQSLAFALPTLEVARTPREIHALLSAQRLPVALWTATRFSIGENSATGLIVVLADRERLSAVLRIPRS